MTYTLQEQYTSRNYTPNSQVPYVFGQARVVTSITIHHWGLNGQQFDTVRDFLCTNTTPTSAHYVAQDGLVACIVSPDDAAWHAGSAVGNATSIGIECRPEATDGDYQTVGELIRFIRGYYGDLPLVPHNHWTLTACPGDYDLDRLDTIARNTDQPTPTDDWTNMTPEQLAELIKAAIVDLAQHNTDFRQAVAEAVLYQPVPLADPTGETGNIEAGRTTTLAAKVTWAAHNDAQILKMETHETEPAAPATTNP